MRKSGLMLALAGALGVLFFWATDPRYGWLKTWAGADNAVDASNQALTGTLVGIAGSVVVLLIGLWVVLRRPT
jgi:hypothetical protein